MRNAFRLCLLLALSSAAFAQTFEVVSIKPNASGAHSSNSNTNRGEMVMRNVTLKQLVRRAYNVEDYAYSAPLWLDDIRFDLNARMPASFAAAPDAKARQAIFQAMMQTMMKERFKLAVHRESKMVAGMALVVGKGGFKIAPDPATDGGSGTSQNDGHVKITRLNMTDIAIWVGRVIQRPVQDKTGLSGVYSFEFDFAPEERLQTDPAKAAEAAPQGPTIYTVLQDLLGLKLQSQKVPVEVVVVDHIERVPTEN